MTNSDKLRFKEVYEKLGRAFGRKYDQAEMATYFTVLEDLPLSAVGSAAFHFAREGTSDNWFPRSPEWYALAAELAIDSEETEQRRALAPSAASIEADMVRIHAARDALIATCYRLGAIKAAKFFETLDVRHPSEDPEAPICSDCGDVGRVYADDGRWGKPCACLDHNPVIKRRARRAKSRGLVNARTARAKAIAPSRASSIPSLLSGA